MNVWSCICGSIRIFKFLNCHKIYDKSFDKKLTKRFENTYRFCNKDINKFCLALKKVVYLYEYMDSLERFKKTKLPIENNFTVT